MKINWGWGIAIFYSTFVVVMIFMVIKASQNKPNMVTENYYEKDIHYQEHFDKIQNHQRLPNELALRYSSEEEIVELTFPENQLKSRGVIHFFRPSNQFEDQRFTIRLNEDRRMQIATGNMKKGLWRVKIDWEANGQQYFKEESISL